MKCCNVEFLVVFVFEFERFQKLSESTIVQTSVVRAIQPNDCFKIECAPLFEMFCNSSSNKNIPMMKFVMHFDCIFSHICIYLSNKFQSMNKYWFWIPKISFIFKIAFMFFFLFHFLSFAVNSSNWMSNRQRFSIIVLIANKYLSSVCQMNSAKVFRGDGFYINKYATNNLYSCLFTFSFSMAHDSSIRLVSTLLANTRKRANERTHTNTHIRRALLRFEGIKLWFRWNLSSEQ